MKKEIFQLIYCYMSPILIIFGNVSLSEKEEREKMRWEPEEDAPFLHFTKRLLIDMLILKLKIPVARHPASALG